MASIFDDPTPAPSSGGSIFDPPPSAAPVTAGIASGPLWNRPAGVSLSDQLMANLAAPFKGGDQAANDYGRVASNALTLGGADRVQSWLTGNTLAQEQKNTADARARLGAMAPITEAATYALGPGELGIAGRLGGGILGSAGEMATAGAIAGANQSSKLSDVPLNMAIGAGAGALGGGAAGAAGKYLVNPLANAVANKAGQWAGALASPPEITAQLKAARDSAYDALKDVPLDPGDTRQALQGIRDGVDAIDPTGGLLKNAPRSAAVLDNLQKFATTRDDISAHDLLSLGLDKLPPPAGGEAEIAPIIKTGLENYLNNSPAAGMVQDAKDAHRIFANARDLQQWGQSLKGFGTSPAGAAQQVAETYYSDPSSPEYKVLSKIALAGGGGISPYGAMHALAPMVDMAAAGTGGLIGGPTGAVVGEHAGNLINYGLLKPAAGAALGAMSRRATQGAINEAYPTLTKQSVRFPPIDAGPALRALLFGTTAPP